MSQRGSGGSTSEYTICLDTVNRDTALYPDTNDLVLNIDNAHLRRGAVQMYVGSFELPVPQFTIEESWQNLWFDEGIRLTDTVSTPPIASGSTVQIYSSASVLYVATIPLFLNSIATITVVSPTQLTIKTLYNHGLQLRGLWDSVNPVASRLPIRLIGTALVNPADVELTAANPNITLIDDTSFQLNVLSTAALGIPGTIINNQGYIFAPAIDSPVALVAVLNSALLLQGFAEGTFGYDTVASCFQFRTVFYGRLPQSTSLNFRCPNGYQSSPSPPGVCFAELSQVLKCMGFSGTRICANSQLSTGQWYIPAECTQLWRSYISITPGFYGPQDLTQLGSEITTQFNRLYIDPGTCSATPSIEYLYFSNAIGACIRFIVPPGGYTPITLANFLQLRMNQTDPNSFLNTTIVGANVYSVSWILVSPGSPNVGFFSFACTGPFGLEFSDSAGLSSMPSRLGFTNVAYRSGPEFSGRNITLSYLGCGASTSYLHSYFIQLLANNGRKGYRIEPSLVRVVPGLRISAIVGSTFTAQNASYAHGFQVGDVISLSFSTLLPPIYNVFVVVTGVANAFELTMSLPVGLAVLLAIGTDFSAQFAYDPATFNIYFPTTNIQTSAFGSIYPIILGFDNHDLMAPAPFVSATTVMLEPPPYLLLQVLDVKSSAYIQHNYLGDNITNILAKVIFFPIYQMQRLYPMSLTFNGSEIITQLHFRWLTPNHQLYQFHGRNWSGTIQFVVLGDSPALACA